MTLSRVWVAPVASLAIMAATVGISQATGTWATSGRQVITAGTSITVDDIKGWMTLQQAADGLGLPVDELIGLIGAPAGVAVTPDTAFKDLESLVPGFELTTFRELLRARLAGVVPSPAGGASASSAPASSAPASSVSATAGDASATTLPPPTASHTPTGTPTGDALGSGAEGTVTGQSTLRALASAAGIDPLVLAAESGLPADVDLDATLRSLRDAYPTSPSRTSGTRWPGWDEGWPRRRRAGSVRVEALGWSDGVVACLLGEDVVRF